jgi:hypothetical protein
VTAKEKRRPKGIQNELKEEKAEGQGTFGGIGGQAPDPVKHNAHQDI